MDARHLDTFHAVVRHGSLRATAKALGCAQSTITVRIQELELELGAQLFGRQGRRTVLTEAGQAVYQRSAQISESIAALKDIAARFPAGSAGRIRFGVIEPTASHRLPAIITPFYADRPTLQLTVEVGGTERLTRLVAEGELDFCISSPPEVESALRFELLFEERIALLTPRRHALALKRRLTPQDLAAYPILLTDRGCAYRRTIETALRAHGVTLPRILEVSSTRAMTELVMAGLGVGFFPIKGATVPNGSLRQVSGLTLSLPIGLVTRADRALTPVQQTLYDRFRSELRR
jgi:LysR family transcriptional regulator, regulator of the ytmI operon